jgi:hypothetical protein
MHKTFREKRNAKKWAAALAVLLAAALCSATVFGARVITGNIENDDFANGEYDNPISIRKTVEETETYRNYKLTLSAEGYDWEVQRPQDVYAVFVIDATASMTTPDVLISEDGSDRQSRFDTLKSAATAYIDAFFEGATAGEGKRYASIVSYGNGARIHLDSEREDALKNDISVNHKQDDLYYTQTVYDRFVGMDGNNGADAYFKQFLDVFDQKSDVTEDFFYKDTSTLGSIVNNLSRFSNTNIESGLLMADFIVRHLPSDAKKYVFLITDGEANASSSVTQYFSNFDLVKEALFTDDDSKPLTTGAGIYSLKQIFERVAAKVTDPVFVSKVTSIAHNEINFFAGDQPRFRDSPTFLDVVGTMSSAAQEIASGAAMRVDYDKDALYSHLSEIDDKNDLTDSDKIKTFNEKVRDFVTVQLFWTAQWRTPYFKSGTGAPYSEEFLTTGEDILKNYHKGDSASGPLTFGMRFDAVFPFGKDESTLIRDYYEHGQPQNITGSDSAKRRMQTAADILQDRATVYAVGIGSSIVMPEKLEQVASFPNAFMLCRDGGSDIDLTARQLRDEFETLGYMTSMKSIENVTLHDEIKRRADGAPIADDDTFTVDVNSFAATLYYYEDGNENTKAVDLVAPDSGFTFTDRPGENYSFSWNAGPLHAKAFAKENPGPKHPYKAELTVNISPNTGVYSTGSETAAVDPDIKTNVSGGVNFDGPSGSETMDYPIPEVYIPAPTNGGGGGGGGGGTPPPSEEQPTTETEEEEDQTPPEEEQNPSEEEEEENPPAVPPGTPVQPGTPNVPPVPYSPGGTLVPLDDGSFLEIDEDGVPLGVWNYDEDEGAWIFDEDVPLALLPQTGAALPAGAAYLWVFPLFALLWLLFVWPRLRRRDKARARL